MENALYNERLARIRKAVALEPVDKIPFAPCGNAFWARSQGVKIGDYVSDFELGCTTNISAMNELGGVDATQNEIFSPYLLATQWLSKIAVPGKELSDDEIWQVMESENMKFEDYKTILDNGFEAFYDKFLVERCGDPEKQLQPFYEYAPKAKERFIEAGIPCVCDFLMITPFEFFCGGRSLECFFMDDLMEEADMIDEVFKLTMDYTLKKYEGMMQAMKPLGVWIGGWRTATEMISMPMWERFVWPYFKQYAELCFKYDVTPIFHLDSNWDLGVERFREMPAKKCIMGLDSKTDIRKAKKAVGDRMAICGDVPAELLTFGEAADVKKYVKDLLDDCGPEGMIISSGCDIPSDAKKENVQAMNDAAAEYLR